MILITIIKQSIYEFCLGVSIFRMHIRTNIPFQGLERNSSLIIPWEKEVLYVHFLPYKLPPLCVVLLHPHL